MEVSVNKLMMKKLADSGLSASRAGIKLRRKLMSKELCPQCIGSKYVILTTHYPDSTSTKPRKVKCDLCNGTGKVKMIKKKKPKLNYNPLNWHKRRKEEPCKHCTYNRKSFSLVCKACREVKIVTRFKNFDSKYDEDMIFGRQR